MVALTDIIEAQKRLNGRIARTPLLRVPALDDLAGCKVFIKAENLQLTGSFKIRERQTVSIVNRKPKARRHSNCKFRNHAKAVCYAAQNLCRSLRCHATTCQSSQFEAIRAFGATVLFAGTASSERACVGNYNKREKYCSIHTTRPLSLDRNHRSRNP